MQKAIVKLAYKHVIDAASTSHFEQQVFHDSYSEFLLQMQAYNQNNQWSTFKEIEANNSKASSLHYKVGLSIGLYVNGLGNVIPNLQDSLQQVYIPFESHLFHLIDSDITNKAAHKVSVTFISPAITLFGCIGNFMILALGGQTSNREEAETFLLQLQPNLSIASYKAQ